MVNRGIIPTKQDIKKLNALLDKNLLSLSAAAKAIGISRPALYRYLNQQGVSRLVMLKVKRFVEEK